MRQTLAGASLIGTGIALLWMFLKIYICGKVYVWEPLEWVLALEIAMCMFLVMFGAMRVYDALKKARGESTKLWSCP